MTKRRHVLLLNLIIQKTGWLTYKLVGNSLAQIPVRCVKQTLSENLQLEKNPN